MELNNIIFSFLLLFVGYFLIKYFLLIFKKSKSNLLADDQFDKPQAFHENSTYRLGGITIFSLLILVFSYFFFFKKYFISRIHNILHFIFSSGTGG